MLHPTGSLASFSSRVVVPACARSAWATALRESTLFRRSAIARGYDRSSLASKPFRLLTRPSLLPQYEGDEVEIPYPPTPAGKGSGEGQTASGRVEGRAFVHGKFVDALRKKAKSAPNCLLVEGTVKDLVSCDDSTRVIGVVAALKPSAANPTPAPTTTLYAPLTIIADGCFSRFRPDNAPAPVTRSHFVGLVLEDAELPVPRHGNVILGSQHGPILLYQIGTHETRMLVDVKGKLPSIGDGSLLRHLDDLVPHLPPLLRPSVTASLERSQREGGTHRLRTMPNSWLPARQQGAPGQREGVVVVGDAWNMRHPLTGGGMSVALADVGHLVRILAPSSALPSLDDWEAYAGQIASWHWQRKNLASVVNVMSVALYDLFGAKGSSSPFLYSAPTPSSLRYRPSCRARVAHSERGLRLTFARQTRISRSSVRAASSTSSSEGRPSQDRSHSSRPSRPNRSYLPTTSSSLPSTRSGACSCTRSLSTLVSLDQDLLVCNLFADHACYPFASEGDIEKPASEGRKVVRWTKPSVIEYPFLTIKAFMVVRPMVEVRCSVVHHR